MTYTCFYLRRCSLYFHFNLKPSLYLLGNKHLLWVNKLKRMARVLTTSFHISLGSLCFWRLGVRHTSCTQQFHVFVPSYFSGFM